MGDSKETWLEEQAATRDAERTAETISMRFPAGEEVVRSGPMNKDDEDWEMEGS